MSPRDTGGISQVSTRFSLSTEMNRVTPNGPAEPASQDQLLGRERGQGTNYFFCSANHEQDWQAYPIDPSLAICDGHTYIHAYIHICTQKAKKPHAKGKNTCQQYLCTSSVSTSTCGGERNNRTG